MTGPVICGVDFSDDSKRALRWANLMAQRSRRPLVVVHAVEPLLADAARLKYGANALNATVQPELDAFVSGVLGKSAHVRTEVGTGDPSGVLQGAATAAGASLIVIGTHGLGQAGHFWFGSTATRVLRDATRPVLVVPPGAASRSDAKPRVSEIIVGTDFGDASSAAIETADKLRRLFDVPVTGLHAVPELAAPSGWSALVADIVEGALREARARLEATVPAGWTNDVRSGDAARMLVDAAAGRHALIVIGLGSAPGQRPGTTAHRVLRDADAPVLSVPAR